jgi:hypothetical protein
MDHSGEASFIDELLSRAHLAAQRGNTAPADLLLYKMQRGLARDSSEWRLKKGDIVKAVDSMHIEAERARRSLAATALRRMGAGQPAAFPISRNPPLAN